MSSTTKTLNQKILDCGKKPRIILAEGWSLPVQQAAEELVRNHPIAPILLFRTAAEVPALMHQGIQRIIIDQTDLSGYASALHELRKSKGMTPEQALEEVRKPNVLAALLVKLNEADGEVCGKEYATKDTLKPALQIIKTKPGCKLVSSVFIMERGNETLLFGDCAINIAPSSEELAEIAKGIVRFARDVLKIPAPKAAMLSYSTLGSGAGESVDRVKKARELVVSDPEFAASDVAGEIQFDAAYVTEVRRQKAPDLGWDKKPDVYVFPTIDAGNIGYKIAQRLGGFEATGPILIGLDKPVNDLSRGASVSEIVNVAIITGAQAALK